MSVATILAYAALVYGLAALAIYSAYRYITGGPTVQSMGLLMGALVVVLATGSMATNSGTGPWGRLAWALLIVTELGTMASCLYHTGRELELRTPHINTDQ